MRNTLFAGGEQKENEWKLVRLLCRTFYEEKIGLKVS